MLRLGRIAATRSIIWHPRPLYNNQLSRQSPWNHQSQRTLTGARTAFSLVRGATALGASVAAASTAAWYSVESWGKEQGKWASDKWERFKDWADHLEFSSKKDKQQGKDEDNHEQDDQPQSPDPNTGAATALAAAASTMLRDHDEPAPLIENKQQQQQSVPTPTTRDAELMVLTRRLIEVRNLLKEMSSNNIALKLPSIVVIGSQSSGKSSVLEAIVGHSFLPKGANMVTRRPIELTLINTPDSRDEYGEFPQLGMGKIHDFSQVQKILTDLNLAVSDAECVSSNPIELRVYSPNVPDLTLIDLPGFIQIHNRNQPPILKEKIAELCESYIAEPNIILAVCAADVDLANSEALRASRKVDPGGRRTIGVITKLDLIDANAGARLLSHNDYPLSLGYVGVVCKPNASMFSNALVSARSQMDTMIRHEQEFFATRPEYIRSGADTGTATLKSRLRRVLEDHMARSQTAIVDAVQTELDEVRYQFKVQYNDIRITPESYVAETVDGLKQRFKEFTKSFGKPQVRDQVRTMLQQRIMDICADLYWVDTRFPMFPRTCSTDPAWLNRVDAASAALTKSGIGRASVQLVYDRIMEAMTKITSADAFANHPGARGQILDHARSLLKSRMHVAADSVENTIKPLKFEVEASAQEWSDAVKRAVVMVEDSYADAERQLREIQSNVGRRRLRMAVRQLQKQEVKNGIVDLVSIAPPTVMSSNIVSAAPIIPPSSSTPASTAVTSITSGESIPNTLAERAKAALSLHRKMTLLKSRSAALKSSLCSSENRSCCPEIILSVIAEKLVSSAVSFISVELLTEFFFDLPRAVDDNLYYGLSKDAMTAFANENPGVKKHLELMQRRRVLEDVMDRLRGLGSGSSSGKTSGR
ncbi:hypothetical protein SmJEL517_g01266 [Synchytrium microbalum]|uniref:dynamin GTPase n=1 Tax=Synchytrium microbalum TaxID=1806994 RepID=A0A507CBL0_9FUNG|nr:uncharacterized protein SmJEL517_g01266 [Synchytrium microbalum]TPX36718.1 hypothetical protein SmJEL517_g01266 [Synchytrium microbalum]